jgi:hypothetical protein
VMIFWARFFGVMFALGAIVLVAPRVLSAAVGGLAGLVLACMLAGWGLALSTPHHFCSPYCNALRTPAESLGGQFLSGLMLPESMELHPHDYSVIFLASLVFLSVLSVSSLRGAARLTCLLALPLPVSVFLFDRKEFGLHAAEVLATAGAGWLTNEVLLFALLGVLLLSTIWPSRLLNRRIRVPPAGGLPDGRQDLNLPFREAAFGRTSWRTGFKAPSNGFTTVLAQAARTHGVVGFEAKLLRSGSWTLVRLPKSASSRLPSRGMVMVEGAINGFHFVGPLEPDGKRGHWLNVNKEMLKASKANPGDTVTVEIEPCQEWPEPEVPKDLRKALRESELAHGTWNDLTAGAHWDWIRWIRSTKNPETRRKRIGVARSKLEAGSRRPCCFNRNECTEAEVSSNGVLRDS